MSGPAYHGRTHAAGGTDPIPGLGTAAETSWATAKQKQMVVVKGDYYRILFTSIATNDSAAFELSGISGTSASWLQLNESGFYEAHFAVSVSTIAVWGTSQYRILEPVIQLVGEETVMNIDQDWSDWMADYNPLEERQSTDIAYKTLAVSYYFNYDKGTSFSGEDPLKLAMRINTTQTANMTLVGQLHVRQLNTSGAYTVTDLTA